MTRVLVTGGSGRLGRAALETLVKEGYETRATSRSARASDTEARPAGELTWERYLRGE
ncbi:hypothetical protein Nocox_31855 [Nonomuraea coxensis DSM 45129]|uniref:NAD-dependent epimerase/dehydratase domain-containing protein n=1 Tax=Nonomuraea coxensis DSM 45129 TaxID=1122611 RepID=A0ABX8UB36_9ACTN|nr:NAD-dependent epimerase/dehydratase family protein [Nonomuraea coxensis]QYC43948.1 hypothetical protein Nocox_31855 [Nonomuraea coxensis DSM 45129]